MLEQREERQRDRLICIDPFLRTHLVERLRGDNGFRQPGAQILFSLPSREVQLIHAQSADDGGQEGFEGENLFLRRGVITDIGFLHHVLRIHRTAQHPVSDGEEVGSVGFKSLCLHGSAPIPRGRLLQLYPQRPPDQHHGNSTRHVFPLDDQELVDGTGAAIHLARA